MKVEIGTGPDQIIGTIETSAEGLKASNDHIALKNIIKHMRRKGQTDEDFLASLPDRLRSYTWARIVEHGHEEPDTSPPDWFQRWARTEEGRRALRRRG